MTDIFYKKQKRQSNELILVRRPCIKILRDYIKMNLLKRYQFLYWSCPPDYGKMNPQAARKLKLDGYEAGVHDLTIIAANEENIKVWLIEFKYGKNEYTKEQKTIADKAKLTQVQPIKIYSQEEFVAFLKNNLI